MARLGFGVWCLAVWPMRSCARLPARSSWCASTRTATLGDCEFTVVEDGQLVSIVSIADAREILPSAWPTTPVRAIMTPVPLKTIPADADMETAIKLLGDG